MLNYLSSENKNKMVDQLPWQQWITDPYKCKGLSAKPWKVSFLTFTTLNMGHIALSMKNSYYLVHFEHQKISEEKLQLFNPLEF